MSLAGERLLLAPWARAFEAVYGWGPVFDDFTADVPEGFTLTVRPAVEPLELLGGTGHFHHRPAMASHVARMGFAWTDARRVVTFPSPATFDALTARLAPPGDGFRVRVHRDPGRNLALGPFLTSYLEGFVPVHVSPDDFYAGITSPKADLRFHFASFAHDMTVHALNYHLVPRDAVEAFRARIEATVPERVAAWRAPGSPGPLTLTTFFDNDLNRFAYAVWARSEAPAHFAGVFRAHLPQLLDCLDLRLDETRRGVGDVPSGDTHDMDPLTRCEFRVG